MMTTELKLSTGTLRQTNKISKPVSKVQSSFFVKKFVAMSISNIVYLRGLLPEKAFMDREMDGVPVKIIYEKSEFPLAVQIVEWIKGAFEAFDKKYLERMELIFFDDKSETLEILESHSFTFTYDNEQVSVTCETAEGEKPTTKFKFQDICFAAVQLLKQTTMLIHNMKKVSEESLMKMRLYYYDDVTPDDYEPPGFEKDPDSEFIFQSENINFRHGRVETGYHSVKLSSKLGLSRLQEPDKLSEEVRYVVDRVQKKSNLNSQPELTDFIPSSQPIPEKELSYVTQKDIENNVSMNVLTHNEKNVLQEDSCISLEETSTDVQNANVYCACGISDDEGLLIFCEICRRWNHAVCYRFLDEKTLPNIFCCVFCHNSIPEAQCNDGSLITLSENVRKMICLYRRALAVCFSSWRVDQRILTNELSVTPEMANDLLAWLEADKVFSSGRKRGKGPYHRVNLTYMKAVIIPAYFQKGLVTLPYVSETSEFDNSKENDDNEYPSKRKLVKIHQLVNTIHIPTRK